MTPDSGRPAEPDASGRADQLIRLLQLQPHPEGGHYREVFRSAHQVAPDDGRPQRSALTSIDFLLTAGQFSAWHRVRSDEAWHLLEGGPLQLWLMPPSLDRVDGITLSAVGVVLANGVDRTTGAGPRHVVDAGWWQAAEPRAAHALAGATVGPGFDFADFAFLRDDAAASGALTALRPDLNRLR